jgi:ADP-L-glycero-D-manno-heptose 6-epimerase
VIVVTGGAGFIGSVLVWYLNRRGRHDILVVDRLESDQKWRNLVGLSFSDYRDKDAFVRELEAGRYDGAVDAIFHLGACSSTTEQDADYLMENNYRYSVRIGEWWERHPAVRFIYASSAATYGNGEQGYRDDESALAALRPLNMYGYSKHLFDLHALRRGWLSAIAGVKYFNVFGPNEDHKAGMRSLVNKAFPAVRDGGMLTLFKSERPDYRDGEQVRDFIYVKDAVAMTLFLADHPALGGIYNVGSGRARSWNDVGRAMFAAVGRPAAIAYTSMPPLLVGTYQYHTQAELGKLRAAGCTHQCLTLEQAVADYITEYLLPGRLIAQGP